MNIRRALGNSLSQPDPFHLILSETLLRAVVKLSRARALVRRHFLRVLKRTAVGEIGGDAGGAERVTADRLGGATAPRITVPYMVPSTVMNGSASASL